MAQEEEVGIGVGKYVLLAVIGIFVIVAAKITSAATTYAETMDVYRHLIFASSVLRYLGIAFLTIPLIAGGILRSDFNPWVRLALLIVSAYLFVSFV